MECSSEIKTESNPNTEISNQNQSEPKLILPNKEQVDFKNTKSDFVSEDNLKLLSEIFNVVFKFRK